MQNLVKSAAMTASEDVLQLLIDDQVDLNAEDGWKLLSPGHYR